jgi:type I restriction-modification system DNA methylase subunit
MNLTYNIDFLKERGFKFFKQGEYQVADASYFKLVYSEVGTRADLDQEKTKISEENTFAASWIFVKSTGTIHVTRPAGETRLFIFNPKWSSQRTEYVAGKLELLENRFSPDEFDELFDVKAVHNHFYNELWGRRLDLAAVLKESHDFQDKQAILIAQRIIDRITFLYFCCENGIITKAENSTPSPTSGRDFFSFVKSSDDVAEILNQIFFDFFATPHEKSLEFGNGASFNIPYLNGGLFLNDSNACGGKTIKDASLDFSAYDFSKLFDLFNSYLWVIEDKTPLSESEEGSNGTLTPEILGHVYEKFVITIEQIENSSSLTFDFASIKELLRTKKGNKKIGAYYTPEDVVQYILGKTIFLCALTKFNKETGKKTQAETFEQFWNEYKSDRALISRFVEILLSLRALDPAVGSGHFLLGAASDLFKMAKLCDPSLDDYDLKKKIITHCLYGVDIMPGAVEICKLRLWLWLISSPTKGTAFPPLPNIEYKIRVGNSLIGLLGTQLKSEHFSTSKTMLSPEALQSKIENFTRQVDEYKDIPDPDGTITENLRKECSELQQVFDTAYFFEIENVKGVTREEVQNLTPFHWGINFFDIFKGEHPQERGFDIILGNPPWGTSVLKPIEKKILSHFEYNSTTEIAATFVERSVAFLRPQGYFAQILADSLVPNDDLYQVRDFVLDNFPKFYLTYIGTRPGKVFDGVEKRVCIGFGQKRSNTKGNPEIPRIYTTRAIMFEAKDRKSLFRNLSFRDTSGLLLGTRIGDKGTGSWLLPKVGTAEIETLLIRLRDLSTQKGWTLLKDAWRSERTNASKHKMMFRASAGYWLNAVIEFPYETSSIKTKYFPSEVSRDFAILLFNSHIMYLFWAVYGNFHHVKESLVENFPFPSDIFLAEHKAAISSGRAELEADLLKNFKRNKSPKVKPDGTKGRDGEFTTGLSKPIIDRLETLIGSIYGFTPAQIEYLCHYDEHIRRFGIDEDEDGE